MNVTKIVFNSGWDATRFSSSHYLLTQRDSGIEDRMSYAFYGFKGWAGLVAKYKDPRQRHAVIRFVDNDFKKEDWI